MVSNADLCRRVEKKIKKQKILLTKWLYKFIVELPIYSTYECVTTQFSADINHYITTIIHYFGNDSISYNIPTQMKDIFCLFLFKMILREVQLSDKHILLFFFLKDSLSYNYQDSGRRQGTHSHINVHKSTDKHTLKWMPFLR